VTADPSTPAGFSVKRAILDIVDIFEVNRKDCARLLLEYPKWAPPGTFLPKQGAPISESDEADEAPKLNLHLENTIIEVMFHLVGLLLRAHRAQLDDTWCPICSSPAFSSIHLLYHPYH
jgi:hypothetical protein